MAPAFSVYSGAANLATGNLTLFHKVTSWMSADNTIGFDLVFNSQASGSSPLGAKWRHSYLSTAVASGSNVVVTNPDGLVLTFTSNGSGFTSPTGHFEVLTSNLGGGYTLIYKDGSKRVFAYRGRVGACPRIRNG